MRVTMNSFTNYCYNYISAVYLYYSVILSEQLILFKYTIDIQKKKIICVSIYIIHQSNLAADRCHLAENYEFPRRLLICQSFICETKSRQFAS